MLQAIREAVDRGLIDQIEDAAHFETLTSLLDRARVLARDGLTPAAGAVGLTVIHEHLRECCVRSACLPSGAPSPDDLATQLFRRGHLSEQQRSLVRSTCEVGMNCQEARNSDGSEEEVLAMLDDVSKFIAAHAV